MLYIITFTTTSYASQENDINFSSANAPIIKDDFEWQFMVDLSLVDTQILLADVEQTEPWDYFQLGLLLDMSYKGFFIQTNSRRSSTALGSAEFGYQITVQNDWQLDVILKAYIQGYAPEAIIKDQEKDIPQLAGLSDRNPTGGIALRYSHFFDDAIFYIDVAAARAVADEQGDDASGMIVDSFYSYLLPYRNWDIYLGAGLTYYEQALVDYYIGINADEVSSARPLYKADGGFRGQLEVYAQYPLSQSWSFNAGITQSFYFNDIKKSPLVDKNKLTQVMVGVLYVF
jgi:outer membrane scaffolding protein for murein synthesis (MipA/OmpV family)